MKEAVRVAVMALSTAAALTLPISAIAQDDRSNAAARTHLAETFAFLEQAEKPCAGNLAATFDMLRSQGAPVPASAGEFKQWTIEFGVIFALTQPPISDDEITAAQATVKAERSQLGDAKWCAIYVNEMGEAHMLMKIILLRQQNGGG